MGTLVFRAKWIVLDEEIAEPEEILTLVDSLSRLNESTVRECFKKGLQVEVHGDVRQATDLDIELGYITSENNLIYVKNLELKWDSTLDAEEYAEEYGESPYMLLEFDNMRVPFRTHESYGIYDK